jgi:hypothetical protein
MKNLYKIQEELYIIDNNHKVFENGIWAMCSFTGDILKNRNGQYAYKVILTTNNLLIKNGVQAIDDDFLEWLVKNPSCEEVEVIYGLFNPMGRQVDPNNLGHNHSQCIWKHKIIFQKEESKQEKMYSEEDMREAIIFALGGMYGYQWGKEGETENQINKYLQELKKK